MGLGRVELPTSRLSGVRSNHLSYRPAQRDFELRISNFECGKPIRKFEIRNSKFLDLRQKAYRRKIFESRKSSARSTNLTLRKEVIQPQVLLRLPCYDFTPITSHTLDGYLLAVELPASSTTGFRDVTGGVYKARERIHRCLLISDY